MKIELFKSVKSENMFIKIAVACLILTILLLFSSCSQDFSNNVESIDKPNTTQKNHNLIVDIGKTIDERFLPPEGFERTPLEPKSFGEYLRNIELKPIGSKVHYFDGFEKPSQVYDAVIDIDVGTRDLQQCADSVIRLRSEYLLKQGKYEQIHFNFTSGFRADYKKWRDGYRIEMTSDEAKWIKSMDLSTSYQDFRKYLDMVYAYAGTASLDKELKSVEVKDMQVGDVFIKGGSPGHCVIVTDMAVNKTAGEKVFMIAQGFMPAQDMHILKNYNDKNISPWYYLDFVETLNTPEYSFTVEQLKRFP